MEIVIEIKNDAFERIKNLVNADYFDHNIEGYVMGCIANGKPLPKGHGDLIDRDAIEVLRIGNIKREYDKGFDAGVTCMVNRILNAPTIIEAEGSDTE